MPDPSTFAECPACKYCGAEMQWESCWNCDDGYCGHDCGEDTCCCADPEPNMLCDVCEGRGGYLQCTKLESNDHQLAVAAARGFKSENAE